MSSYDPKHQHQWKKKAEEHCFYKYGKVSEKCPFKGVSHHSVQLVRVESGGGGGPDGGVPQDLQLPARDARGHRVLRRPHPHRLHHRRQGLPQQGHQLHGEEVL